MMTKKKLVPIKKVEMVKKIDTLIVKIQRQEEKLLQEQENLMDMLVDLNEEKLTQITKTLRALSKDQVLSIIDYFVGEHLADCTDETLTYAMGTHGNVCPRCSFLWLYKNKSEAAPFLLRDYMFSLQAEPIRQRGCEGGCEGGCEDCNGECEEE
jgi:DNA-directed RNA polymerase subunit RPC12/RpoP